MKNILNISYVKRYDFVSDQMILLIDDEIQIFDRNCKKVRLYKYEGTYGFVLFDNGNLLFSILNPNLTYEVKLDDFYLKEYSLHLPGIKFNDSFYCLSDFNGDRGFIELNSNDLNPLNFWKLPVGINGIKIISHERYFSFKKNQIAAYELPSLRESWNLDIYKKGSYVNNNGTSESGRVRGLNIYKDILIAEITGIFLLGINSLTGEILWEQHFDNNLFFTCCQEGNRIHAFSYGTYYEIDIESGEILRQKSLELELQARDCSPASHTAPAVNEKYIAIAPGFRPKALLIDRERLEIVQELDLKGSYVNNSEILQFHDNRLYILDAHNTLHIFEDE